MNGTTRSLVMSRPFSSAAHARRPRPRRAAATSGRDPARSSSAIDDRAQRDDRADRQIDPAGDDHHRHAERGDADDGGLARHQLEVGRR